MEIGDVVTLDIPMLGCRPGTRGIVFNTYQDFDDESEKGVQIIFENGIYDGFSVTEQNNFLSEEHMDTPFFVKRYKFTNVMKVSQDFNDGFWDDFFR